MSDTLTLLVYVVSLPLVWIVTVSLARLSRQAPDSEVLFHAFLVTLALALIVTVFSLIFANNDLEIPVLTNEQTRLVTRSAVLSLSVVPALYWLAALRRLR